MSPRFKILYNGDLITATDDEVVAALAFQQKTKQIENGFIGDITKLTLELQDTVDEKFSRLTVETGVLLHAR